eukprot:m.122698 g.122698  ORF g.122698 m.122698 type:complete len:687 (+) comp9312_c1_seq1:266-2326(+)
MAAHSPLYCTLETVEDCRGRDRRCCRALRVAELSELPCFGQSAAVEPRSHAPTESDAHIISPITRNGCMACHPGIAGAPDGEDDTTSAAQAGGGECTHMKSMFNSTKNIKRRVHTLLFWKRHLGLHFPITDPMLKDNVWKSLSSCDLGIKQTNGHPKVRGQGSCINPYHYDSTTLQSWTVLMDVLVASIIELASDNTAMIESLIKATSDLSGKSKGNRASPGAEARVAANFQKLCAHLRSAPLQILPGPGEGPAASVTSAGSAPVSSPARQPRKPVPDRKIDGTRDEEDLPIDGEHGPDSDDHDGAASDDEIGIHHRSKRIRASSDRPQTGPPSSSQAVTTSHRTARLPSQHGEHNTPPIGPTPTPSSVPTVQASAARPIGSASSAFLRPLPPGVRALKSASESITAPLDGTGSLIEPTAPNPASLSAAGVPPTLRDGASAGKGLLAMATTAGPPPSQLPANVTQDLTPQMAAHISAQFSLQQQLAAAEGYSPGRVQGLSAGALGGLQGMPTNGPGLQGALGFADLMPAGASALLRGSMPIVGAGSYYSQPAAAAFGLAPGYALSMLSAAVQYQLLQQQQQQRMLSMSMPIMMANPLGAGGLPASPNAYLGAQFFSPAGYAPYTSPLAANLGARHAFSPPSSTSTQSSEPAGPASMLPVVMEPPAVAAASLSPRPKRGDTDKSKPT